MSVYGLKVPRSTYTPQRDVIGAVERTISGNVVLRVGQENLPLDGWHQTAHVVVTADEAAELSAKLAAAAAGEAEFS